MNKEFSLEYARKCFNECWNYIEKTDRTIEDDFQMIHLAHASRFHWSEVGGPTEAQAGEWQISKVYNILGHAESAMVHAKECLRICEENNIKDFNICFAHEAMANAYKLLGDEANKDKHLSIAMELTEFIEDKGNKEYTIGELKKV